MSTPSASGFTSSDKNTAPPAPSQGSGDESLQPAVIAALVIASVAVLMGFVLLFVLWRRQYLRERRDGSETHPRVQLQSQDDTQGGKLNV